VPGPLPSAEQWNDRNGVPRGSTHISTGYEGIAALGVRGCDRPRGFCSPRANEVAERKFGIIYIEGK
jgi:hypothetical protein